MGLSCDYDFDPDAGQTVWEHNDEFTTLATRRRRKCCSCKARIEPGAKVVKFRRWKVPEYDIEISLYGDDGWDGPPRAPMFHCEPCGNLYLFLQGFKYSFPVDDDMRKLAKEHAKMEAQNRAGCQ